ncbi:exported hypothetical protein [Acidobacteriia bacterium SbA2]|nr:exported hypothetical protein [Acidobacteriia bacterium SbA2]
MAAQSGHLRTALVSMIPSPVALLPFSESHASGWFNERNFKWPEEGRGFRVCLRTRFCCHSEEPQATRNLALA